MPLQVLDHELLRVANSFACLRSWRWQGGLALRFRLDGRIALITGGSQGLGQIIAETFASVGATVVIVSRRQSACEEVAEKIRATCNTKAYAVSADVSCPDDVATLASQVQSTVGDVDILVNSAGVNIRGPIEKLSVEDWDQVLDII